MNRTKKSSRRSKAEPWAADDVVRQQLGWYVRNCALSPAAGLLEKIIFLRLDRLRAREDDWDLPDAERASVHAIDRDRC